MGRVWFLIGRGRVDYFASYFYGREEVYWSIATAVGTKKETKETAVKHRVKASYSYPEEVL